MSSCHSSLITIEDVRLFMYDRTAGDNELLGALAFSDDEIRAAMRFAAREYNSIPPVHMKADPDALSGDTNMFLDAIAAGLFISKSSQMKRNQVEYSAGGASVGLEKIQIAYMQEQIKFHQERYKAVMAEVKQAENQRGFYGVL